MDVARSLRPGMAGRRLASLLCASGVVALLMTSVAASAASAASRPLGGKVIGIDPGHNGRNWTAPRFLNKKETRKNNHGVGPCVNRRARMLNRAHANVSIDIHADYSPLGRPRFHDPGACGGRTE
jgi:N-acetylmuramoyl-L-alanine amidase